MIIWCKENENFDKILCANKRHKQFGKLVGAVFLLVIAVILLSIGEGSGKGSSGSNPDLVLFYGIIPVLVASVLSGLASSLCQWASQVRISGVL